MYGALKTNISQTCKGFAESKYLLCHMKHMGFHQFFLQTIPSKESFCGHDYGRVFPAAAKCLQHSHFPSGWGSASLPLISPEVPFPHMDRTPLQKWPALGIVASRSPSCPTMWLLGKDVSRTFMFIPLLPCSLEGIPFQLWTVIRYKGPEWNGLQECVPRDKKGICWAFVRL